MPTDSSGSQPAQNWNPVLRTAELTVLLNHLQTIKEGLPFLIGLSSGERRRISKVGTRTEGFLQTALMTAMENPGLLPASLSAETLAIQAETLENLRLFKTRLSQLQETLEDTERQFASQLYGVTRTVYQLMKSPMRPAGLNERHAQLAQRFARRAVRRPDEEGPPRAA